MAKKKKSCQLVMIAWVDSRRPDSEWSFLSTLPEKDIGPVECVSVGWLLLDGETKVLCPNMGDLDSCDPQGSGMIQIPSAAVTKVSSLQEISS